MAVLRRILRWLNASLLRQLAALLVGLALLVTLCAGMVTRFLYTEEIVRIATEAQQMQLLAQKTNLDRMMKDYAYVLFEMAVDVELLEAAREMHGAPERLPAYRQHWLREKLGVFTSYRQELVAVGLWAEDGHFVVFDRTEDSTTGRRGIWQGHLRADIIHSCEQAVDSGEMLLLPTKEESNDKRFLHLFFPIRDLYTRRSYGVLVLSFDQANLARALADQPAHVWGMLLNRDGLIVSHPDSRLLGLRAALPGEESLGAEVRLSDHDIVQQIPLERMGLRLISIIDRDGLLNKALNNMRFTQAVVAGICLAFLIAAYALLRLTHHAFRVLLDAIAQVRRGNIVLSIQNEQLWFSE